MTIRPTGDERKGNAWARIVIDSNSSFQDGKGHKRVFALRHPKSATPGLFVSQDYGSSWLKIASPLEFNYLTLISDHENTILFASVISTKKTVTTPRYFPFR